MRMVTFGWVCRLQVCFQCLVCAVTRHHQTNGHNLHSSINPQGRHCCGPSPSQTWMSAALRNLVHETYVVFRVSFAIVTFCLCFAFGHV